jgi:hypothetical protein
MRKQAIEERLFFLQNDSLIGLVRKALVFSRVSVKVIELHVLRATIPEKTCRNRRMVHGVNLKPLLEESRRVAHQRQE